ncbi:MAG: hypothetical protein AAGA91_10655 [Pseudomonadota bacterium]
MIRENGQIRSRLDDLNIPIYCPLSIQPFGLFYEVGIVASNRDVSFRRFVCVLSEYNIVNQRVRSLQRAANIAPGESDFLFFQQVELEDSVNRLDLRCEMPPKGAYGAITVDNVFIR